MSIIAPPTGYNDRVKLSDVLPLETPFTLNVFPTNACNLKCNYCVHSMGKNRFDEYPHMRGGNMTMETFDNIIKESKRFLQKYKLLSFMGHGEPLLNHNLPEMIAIAVKEEVAERVEIISNGILLNRKLTTQLIDAGLDNLRISLQGFTDKQYYDTAQKNVVFKDFLDEMKFFYNYSRSSKTRLFVKVLDCALDPGQEDEFFSMFQDCTDRMFIERVKPVYKGVTFTKDITDLSTDRYGTHHAPRMVCPLPFFTMAVWPNGDIAPCDAIYFPTHLGNVNNVGLLEAFHGDKMREFRAVHLAKSRNKLPGCGACCAPDDVSNELDELDTSAEQLIPIYSPE